MKGKANSWLIRLVVVAIALGGGWGIYARTLGNASDAVEVRTIEVKRETVENTIDASGTVELANQQTLLAPADTTVTRVLVEPGDRVSQGQQVAILRNTTGETNLRDRQVTIEKQELELANKRQAVIDEQAQLDDARVALQDAITSYENRDRGQLRQQRIDIETKQLQLANQRQKVREAEKDLQLEIEKLETDRALEERGFISGDRLQDQENAVRSARTRLRDAKLEVRTQMLQLENARLTLQQNQRELQQSELDADAQLRQAETTVREAETAVEQAESVVRTARLNLEQSRLEARKIEQELQENIVIAPTPGKILDVVVQNGDVVKLGEPLLTLGDPSQQLVQLNLSTLNARRVKPNQPVRVSLIGPDANTFDGRLERVGQQAKVGGEDGGSAESGQATVAATVRLERPSDRLIPGIRVSVEIVLEREEDAIAIGTEAIQQLEADPFVWVRDESGRASKQPVEVGLEGLTVVEIQSGLDPGDEVVLPPVDKTLEPGMMVVASQDENGSPEP
jgi:HlyD family secretion protein